MKLALRASPLLAFALSASAGTASADPADVSLTYAVRSEYGSTTSTTTTSELVTLHLGSTRSFVTVGAMNGAVLSYPTQVLPDGEVTSNAGDPAVSCYNTAKALLPPSDATATPRGAVFLSFGSGVVRVAVPLRITRQSQGTTSYHGTGLATFAANVSNTETPVRIETSADVVATGDTLREAEIVTTTSLGSPEAIVGRTACSLTSAPASASPATLSDVPFSPGLQRNGVI